MLHLLYIIIIFSYVDYCMLCVAWSGFCIFSDVCVVALKYIMCFDCICYVLLAFVVM